jgi:hypothetical protein
MSKNIKNFKDFNKINEMEDKVASRIFNNGYREDDRFKTLRVEVINHLLGDYIGKDLPFYIQHKNEAPNEREEEMKRRYLGDKYVPFKDSRGEAHQYKLIGVTYDRQGNDAYESDVIVFNFQSNDGNIDIFYNINEDRLIDISYTKYNQYAVRSLLKMINIIRGAYFTNKVNNFTNKANNSDETLKRTNLTKRDFILIDERNVKLIPSTVQESRKHKRRK